MGKIPENHDHNTLAVRDYTRRAREFSDQLAAGGFSAGEREVAHADLMKEKASLLQRADRKGGPHELPVQDTARRSPPPDHRVV